MKYTHHCCKPAILTMLLASVGLSGCDQLTPNGQSSTMTLLRSGSEKTCTASDVQDTLRKMIMPSSTAGDDPDRRAAMAGITISYEFTTLSAFDKAVSKASCNTSATITGPGAGSSKFDVEYTISPSSDNPSTFIISTRNGDAGGYAEQLVSAGAAQAAADRATKQQLAQAQEAKAKLLAVINPSWIAGAWISPDKDPSSCTDDIALRIASNHSFASQGLNGQWTLDGDQLHFVGYGSSGSVNNTSTITQADAASFATANSDGTTSSWRRCPADPIMPPSLAPAPAATPNVLDPSPHPEAQPG